MNPSVLPIPSQQSDDPTSDSSEVAIPLPPLASQPQWLPQPPPPFPRTNSSSPSISSDNHSSSGPSPDKIRPTVVRNRKKTVHWTKEEHLDFLSGLEGHGKGKWKSISKNAVKTKTPSQIASHAQKHFRRQKVPPERRKRASIHDIIITDVIAETQILSGHPTPIWPEEPPHLVAPPPQVAAPTESRDLSSTSSAPARMKYYESDGLLYLPGSEWLNRFG